MLPQMPAQHFEPEAYGCKNHLTHRGTSTEPAPGWQHHLPEEQVPPTAPGCAATHPSPVPGLSHRHCCCSRAGWKQHRFVLETFSFWRKQHSKSHSFLIPSGEAQLTGLGTSCTFSQAFVLHYLSFFPKTSLLEQGYFFPLFSSKG